MRLWLVSTEQKARLIDRVLELEAEADFNARAAIRLKAENGSLALELRAAQAFAQDGYRQFREAQAKLDAAAKSEPGAPGGNAGEPTVTRGVEPSGPAAESTAGARQRPAPPPPPFPTGAGSGS
jgi:hypothetical protein